MSNLKIIDKVRDFPTLPTIYSKILEAISNPSTTVQDLAILISKDIALTTKLLQVVNSPIYSIRGKVDTITQAIFYIGFTEVRNICLAISIFDIFKNSNANSNFNIIELWKHSISVGVITRLLGGIFNIKNLDNFFAAGLIHDIGKLFFSAFYEDKYSEIIDKSIEYAIPLNELEKRVFGTDHAELGYLIARKWNLPDTLANSIKHHTTGTFNGKFDLIVACVHLGNIISQLLQLGKSGNYMINEPNFAIWDHLSFDSVDLKEFRNSVVHNYEISISILKM